MVFTDQFESMPPLCPMYNSIALLYFFMNLIGGYKFQHLRIRPEVQAWIGD